MDKEYYDALAKVRLERAKNIKTLLAMAQIKVTTHNGGLKQFN